MSHDSSNSMALLDGQRSLHRSYILPSIRLTDYPKSHKCLREMLNVCSKIDHRRIAQPICHLHKYWIYDSVHLACNLHRILVLALLSLRWWEFQVHQLHIRPHEPKDKRQLDDDNVYAQLDNLPDVSKENNNDSKFQTLTRITPSPLSTFTTVPAKLMGTTSIHTIVPSSFLV